MGPLLKKLLLLIYLLLLFNVVTLEAYPWRYKLPNCMDKSNCFFVELSSSDLDEKYSDLFDLADGLPRSELLEKSKNYSHWIVKSLVFSFPDDLELLKNTAEGSIQIKSSSRLGKYAFGVNRRRIENLSN